MYQHHPDRLKQFFQGIYDMIQKSRSVRREMHADGYPGVEPLPPFDIWMGNEGLNALAEWETYHPAADPRLN